MVRPSFLESYLPLQSGLNHARRRSILPQGLHNADHSPQLLPCRESPTRETRENILWKTFYAYGCRSVGLLLQFECDQQLAMTYRAKLDWALTAMQYTPGYRVRRRLFEQNFKSSIASKYQERQVRATTNMLGKFAESPERFSEHIHLCVHRW